MSGYNISLKNRGTIGTKAAQSRFYVKRRFYGKITGEQYGISFALFAKPKIKFTRYCDGHRQQVHKYSLLKRMDFLCFYYVISLTPKYEKV